MMQKTPVRVLIGKGGLDGHDRGVKYVAHILRNAGFEVIYPGIRRSPEQIVDVAIKNDLALIGLSFLSGAHIQIFTRVVELLKAQNAEDIILVCGGVIPSDDIAALKLLGVAEVFTPGISDDDIIKAIKKDCSGCVNYDRKQLVSLADPKTNAGWVRAAARLMSLAERSPEDAVAVVAELSGSPKPRIVLGVTGAPGSGKSMLVSRLITAFRTMHPDKRVGVIAVDPSSPFSGGAILGDQIRMMEHSGDDMVFIRSVASRGQTGGITFGTLGTLSVMGHIGCDIVLIETVGVGQSEIEVREVADIVAVVLAPGQGDTVQFLKAGLMEIGDCFVVNKSDRSDAPRYRALLEDSLVLLGKSTGTDRTNDLFSASARDNTGIIAIAEYAEKRCAEGSKDWEIYRTENMHAIIRRLIIEKCKERAKEKLAMTSDPVGRILSGQETVRSVSEEVFNPVVH